MRREQDKTVCRDVSRENRIAGKSRETIVRRDPIPIREIEQLETRTRRTTKKRGVTRHVSFNSLYSHEIEVRLCVSQDVMGKARERLDSSMDTIKGLQERTMIIKLPGREPLKSTLCAHSLHRKRIFLTRRSHDGVYRTHRAKFSKGLRV